MSKDDKNVILIVDDIEINRVILAETFRENYDILEAENGEEALKIIDSDERVVCVFVYHLITVIRGI